MSKKLQKPFVPTLRFPEFRESGEWETKTLSSLAKRRTERNNNGNIKRVLTNSAVNGVIDQRDFFEKDIANQNNLENYFIVDIGDYVYNPRISVTAPVGPLSKNRVGKGVMSPLYTVFRFDSLKNEFFEQYFKTTYWHRYLYYISNTGARHDRMSISNNDFMKIPLPYPAPSEQQKIADCLSYLDELITSEDHKLDIYKSHKKSLMQNLFPAEGETVPKLRFPEFRSDGEWVEYSLDDIAYFFKGKGISKAEIDTQGETLCIRYGELYTTYGEVIREVFSKTKLPETELFFSQRNDVLIPSSGETKIDIAKASCVLLDNVALGGDLNVLRSDKNGIFLSYLLNGAYKREIAKKAQGDSIVHLYASQLKLLNVLIPNIKEQQKIAYCLSILDDLITAQAQKCEALKTHKKGLMQGLFLSIDEVAV